MKHIFIILAAILIFISASAQQDSKVEYLRIDSSVLSIHKVTDSLHIPWEILWGPDNYIWLTERAGRISRMDPATGRVTLLTTIPDCYAYVTSGLLGMALHPDFENTPYLYVAYTISPSDSSQIMLKIRRYTYDKTNQTLIEPKDLTKPLIMGWAGTYGCRLLITPQLELFATIGDAADYSAPPDTNNLLGKILRLDLEGHPYPGNPFHNEVYSYGHRNPEGLVLGPNGILYSSEHGPSHDDEINIIKKGLDYGWPEVGGKTDEPKEKEYALHHKVEDAIYFWTPTIAPCGLDYYDKNAIPEFSRSLILTTLKQNDLRILTLDSSGTHITKERILLAYRYGRIRDVCISPDGRIFFSTSNDKNHPDQIKSGYDAIYEMRFDHKYDQAAEDAAIAASKKEERARRFKIFISGKKGIAAMALILVLFFLLMGSFAYKNKE